MIDKLKLYGADIDGTMERFMGDTDLYISCINLFLKDESIETLDKAIEEKNYKSAFEAAHTLKGVVGNLGLTPLYKAVSLLVESLRSNALEDLDEEYNEYLKQKEIFINVIV